VKAEATATNTDMRKHLAAGALTCAAVLALGAVQPTRPPAEEVAAALQRKYDTIRDFTADFTQVYVGGVLRRRATESGTVAIKKPGKMRWDYQRPEKKVFISDGERMYLYVPADKQVTISPVPDEDRATSAVLFLMGKGNLTRDFNVSYAAGSPAAPDGPPDTYTLRLDPRIRQAEYDWLEIAVDRETLQIKELTAGDAQGGRSTFRFSNFKENARLADKMFVFTVPRGTDVITSGTAR
jgi:outer membrane lipoprotein carrier protein